MSLRKLLNDSIRQNGYLSINDIYKLTEDYGCKRSNAERRLRRSESPNITPVMKKGYIVGYKWGIKDNSYFEKPKPPQKEKLEFGNTKQIYALKHKKDLTT